MINKDRLSETFIKLVKIDSVSREEGEISNEIQTVLRSLGAEIYIDDAGKKVGGQTGNLIAEFKGNVEAEPLLLNAHMDTVEPGRGVVPVVADGIFTSQGDTILGADDKSALAILLEVLQTIQENDIPHAPLEVIFTVCEEIGLLGARYLNFDKISAKYGFALDATDTNGVITRAPSANHIAFKIHGRAAHAGAKPELGINAIHVAGKAIADLELGRIDQETTCNIGVIEGGLATNIVPDLVTVKGEARSHSEKKLQEVTDRMVACFENAVKDYQNQNRDEAVPSLETSVEKEFSRTDIPETHYVVELARQAAQNLGRKIECKTSGGGADANFFYQNGIFTGVLGTGMKDMHTTHESVALDDMADTAELLIEIIKLHSRRPLL